MAEPTSEGQGQAQPGAVAFEANEFASLLQKEFKPKSDKAKEAVETAVRTLAEQALRDTAVISGDVLATIEALIAQIDRKLTDQVNQIIHSEEFQKVESAWRGLHYLVNNTETDETLKIRVMNISKGDLHKSLKKYKGTAWDQSPFFKKLYEEEYGQFGGEPYGALVADYYFDNSGPDVDLLTQMAKISAAAHAPLITGADPTVMLMDSWQELANPRDLTKIFQTPEHAAWRSLRESEDSRYVGLAMPRFLARAPYGAKSDPVEAFDFEEDTAGANSSKYAWANASYAMATNINRSFKLYGWCSDSRHRVGRLGRRAAGSRVPDRRWRRRHEVSHLDRDQRPPRGGTREERFHAARAQEELRFRRLHRRAIAAQAGGVRGPGCH